jgi:hypothetical protein
MVAVDREIAAATERDTGYAGQRHIHPSRFYREIKISLSH